MAKETKKHNRLKYLIMSVIIAVVAWTIVAYSTDPDVTRTVTGVKVELAGVDKLQERGLVVVNAGELPKMSVKVTGKRSDIINIMDDMRVVVDVSSLESSDKYRVDGSVKISNSRVTVNKIINNGVNINVEKMETREVNILIYQDGEVQGKIVETVPLTKTVAISGATSELDLINGAYATINLNDVKEEGKATLETAIAPKDGVNLDELTTLVLQNKNIEVENIFYTPMEIPVHVTSIVEGYEIDRTKTVVSPQTVMVGIKDGNDVPFLTATLTEYADHEVEVLLNEFDGVYIPDNVKTVTVAPAWKETVN